jgi:hypothetical protein
MLGKFSITNLHLQSIFFFLVQLAFELTTLSLQGRCSAIWTSPPALYALAIFEIGPHFCSDWLGSWNPYFMLPALARMTGTCRHTQLWVVTGFCKFFVWVDLEFRFPNLSSQVTWATSAWLRSPLLNFLFWNRVLLSCPGWLELAVFLPQPPYSGIACVCHHTWLSRLC